MAVAYFQQLMNRKILYPEASVARELKLAFFSPVFFFLKDELIHELKQTLNAIKLEEKGVYVQASTLGSLEALLEFLKTSEVPVSTTVLYLMPVILCFSQ